MPKGVYPRKRKQPKSKDIWDDVVKTMVEAARKLNKQDLNKLKALLTLLKR